MNDISTQRDGDLPPGWFDFQDIYDAAVVSAPALPGIARFVELGVCMGRSAIYMARKIRDSGKDIRFDAVDKWGDEIDSFGTEFRALKIRHGGYRQAFEFFLQEAGVERYAKVIQQAMVERAQAYPDASLDFVFLDGCHTYQGTRGAIVAYLPKLKPGATFAGHDYNNVSWPGVQKAVKELLPGHSPVRSSFVWKK